MGNGIFKQIAQALDRDKLTDLATGLVDGGMSTVDVEDELLDIIDRLIPWDSILPVGVGHFVEYVVEDAILDMVVRPIIKKAADPEFRKEWWAKRKDKIEDARARRSTRNFTVLAEFAGPQVHIKRNRDGQVREVRREDFDSCNGNLRKAWRKYGSTV